MRIHSRWGCYFLLLAMLFAIASSPTTLISAGASETPLKLKWANLIPPAPPIPKSKLKTFWARGPVTLPSGIQEHSGSVPRPKGDGRWMSSKSTRLNKPPAVVEKLNGKHVQIGGYVVPLSFDETTVKEFLLVPFVGACLHVPPPPANQIIFVKAAKGFEVKSTFEPVYVTGKLKTETSFTGLADTGYTLDADVVEKRAE